MKRMLELRKGNFVAIINNERLVEIEEPTKEMAYETIKRAAQMYNWEEITSISICEVPVCVSIL